MKCCKCGSGDLGVLDTGKGDLFTKRSRKCLNCNHRFETIEIDLENMVFDNFFKEIIKISGVLKEIKKSAKTFKIARMKYVKHRDKTKKLKTL